MKRAFAGVGKPLKWLRLLSKLNLASLYDDAIVIIKDKYGTNFTKLWELFSKIKSEFDK